MNLETNWMSKSELRDYLGFSMGKIETMMKSNGLPYYKVGKCREFLLEDLKQYRLNKEKYIPSIY